MIITFGTVHVITLSPELADEIRQNSEFLIPSTAILSIAVAIGLTENKSLCNITFVKGLIITVLTISQSLLVGTLSTLFSPRIFYLTQFHRITAFIVMILNIIRKRISYFTILGNAFIALTTSLCIAYILHLLKLPVRENVISWFLGCLSSFYVGYDTRRILKSIDNTNYDDGDMILAALSLYADFFLI
jgi:FtsH-binding integral membrane protein